MTHAIEVEGRWLVSRELHSKTLFLATLMHELTIVGRNSYCVQSEELDKPSQLRKINEVQHRVAACLRQILSGQADEGFQESIASWVLEQQDDELQGLMSYAWSNAKRKSNESPTSRNWPDAE